MMAVAVYQFLSTTLQVVGAVLSHPATRRRSANIQQYRLDALRLRISSNAARTSSPLYARFVRLPSGDELAREHRVEGD